MLVVAYATGRASHARQVKGDKKKKKGYPGSPGWGLGVRLTTSPCKKYIVTKPQEEAGAHPGLQSRWWWWMWKSSGIEDPIITKAVISYPCANVGITIRTWILLPNVKLLPMAMTERSLVYGMSAAARLLRLWVRILPRAWISVSCGSCVLSSKGHCDELITRQAESYRPWCVVMFDPET
jgi:hypothetical protein